MSASETKHEYQEDFFDYINSGSTASATVVCPILIEWLKPVSLLDVGCGAGAWCRKWTESGVAEVVGVDGDYVNPDSLLMPKEQFRSRDLSKGFDLERKFDLVTSLEVAEHVAEESSRLFVENLSRHGDRILFSAAVPGQGGEFHVNEKPLDFWREHFASFGFRCFDPLRPRILTKGAVEPWYRYNTLLYLRDSVVSGLPEEVKRCEVLTGEPIADVAPWSWRARNAFLRNLPEFALSSLVQLKHAWIRKSQAGKSL